MFIIINKDEKVKKKINKKLKKIKNVNFAQFCGL